MKIFLRFGVAGLYVVTNGKISFVCFVLLGRASFLSVNFSHYFFNERKRVASLTESVCKVSFALFEVLVIKLSWFLKDEKIVAR